MTPRQSRPSNLAELGQRIREVAKLVGGHSQAAEMVGVAVSTFGRWAAGKNEPPISAMALLASGAAVRLEWLATGDGDMQAGAPPSDTMPPAVQPSLHPIEVDRVLLEDSLEMAKTMLERGNELRAARGEAPLEITMKSLAGLGGEIYEQSYNAWVQEELSRERADTNRREVIRPVAVRK